MIASGSGGSGIIKALDLRALGCLFLACFLVLFAFIMLTVLLFDDDDSTAPDLPAASAQCNEMPKGMPDSPYVQVAWDDATKYGICPRYFVRQINQESGFNPNARSKVGAVGIAQFMAGTAPTWGLKVGGGVDERLDPEKALDASARMMEAAYKGYLKSNPPEEAYKKALAAYNGGPGVVQDAERKYGSQWFSGLNSQSYNYVIIIMELNIPKK